MVHFASWITCNTAGEKPHSYKQLCSKEKEPYEGGTLQAKRSFCCFGISAMLWESIHIKKTLLLTFAKTYC